MNLRCVQPDEELKFLLKFFGQKSWNDLPSSLPPVWFHAGGSDEFCTDKPLRILMSRLEHVIPQVAKGMPGLGRDTANVLWELQAMCIVAGEYREDSFFQLPLEKNTPGEFLWNAVSRFCRLAISDKLLDEVSGSLNFDYFVQQYCSLATDDDLKLFPVR